MSGLSLVFARQSPDTFSQNSGGKLRARKNITPVRGTRNSATDLKDIEVFARVKFFPDRLNKRPPD
jgi:hypothetical protein